MIKNSKLALPHSFKILSASTLEEAYSKYIEIWSTLTTHRDLCVFDIDGVFFERFISVSSFTFKIKKEKLEFAKKIVGNASRWVFTDRPKILLNPIKEQLKSVFQLNDQNHTFDNHSDFNTKIEKYSPFYAIIYHASKRTRHAEETIKKTCLNFDRVFYFASQDLPLRYEDLDLLERIESENKDILKNLTFVDIRK